MPKLPPAVPEDPEYMLRWYESVRDEIENPEAVDRGKKSTRGRNEKTDNYTLVSTDSGKSVVLTGSAAKTFTLDASLLSQNDQGIIRQEGSGQITIAAATGTTLRYPASFTNKTKEQWSWVAWERISTTEVALIGHMESA